MAPKKKASNAAPVAASGRATRSQAPKAAPVDNNGAADSQNDVQTSKPARATKRVPTTKTTQSDSQSVSAPEIAKPARGRKRVVTPASDENDAQPSQKKTKASTAGAGAATSASKESHVVKQQSPEIEDAQVAKPGVKIPLDENIAGELVQYEVYIDDNDVIYDASLNQTNAGANNNKFYRVQLLRNGKHISPQKCEWLPRY